MIIITLALLAGGPVAPVEKAPVASAPVNVLVVGLDQERIASNYYPGSLIAEITGIPEDSLATRFNRAIVDRLAGVTRGTARFIPLDGAALPPGIVAHLRYEGEEESARSDLSRVDGADLSRLLDRFGADYLLVMSRYYMKKEEEPFPYLYHIFNYEVYDRHKSRLHEGRACFDTPALLPAPRLDKHYRDLASRVASRVNKLVAARAK
jgi:hypothetical protein